MPRRRFSDVEKLCGCQLADCSHRRVSAEKRAEYALGGWSTEFA